MSKFFQIVVVLAGLMLPGITNAQNTVSPKPEKNVPAVVVSSFSQKFPTHEPVWFSQYNGVYSEKLVFEGRFIFDKRYSSAIYNTDGAMIAFTASVEKSEIPPNAIKYMDEKYPSFPLNNAQMVTRGENQVTYEIGIFIDNQFVIAVFSETGDFIKLSKA